ncbi:N-methyl-L-tryptophan oxidase [Pendulispora brunnea]|uniref:N-methyl-L-tryptophan oxidase n=1 Tax=Pendulispora brunnea TaxID=2905690 RepID=A0ABZ2JUL9_9BACT
MKSYDVAVIGLGIVGASAVDYLAAEGIRAIGLDAFGPTHGFGSSRGESRIFRRAYWEGAAYLPLLNRAHDLWTALQADCDVPVVVHTGGLFVGSKATGVVRSSRDTARAGNIPHEMLDAAQVRERYPAFRMSGDMEAIYEPGAYMVLADRARLAMLDRAVGRGAELRFGTRVSKVTHSGGGITLSTASGDSFACAAVVVATGPWIAGEFIEEVRPFLRPVRVPIYWFRPRPGEESEYDPGRFPVFLHEASDGRLLYGLPSQDDAGVKIGFHNRQQVEADPRMPDRVVSDVFRNEMADYIEEVFPSLDPVPIRSRICFYTLSNDGNFIIDRTRHHPNVSYASACSGHGFKFAPAVGESAARLAIGKDPIVSLEPYALSRFTG